MAEGLLMRLQSLLGSDHNGRTTAGGQGQSEEQHEGVSGPCTMTKPTARDGSRLDSAAKSNATQLGEKQQMNSK